MAEALGFAAAVLSGRGFFVVGFFAFLSTEGIDFKLSGFVAAELLLLRAFSTVLGGGDFTMAKAIRFAHFVPSGRRIL